MLQIDINDIDDSVVHFTKNLSRFVLFYKIRINLRSTSITCTSHLT
jgi:hypothetical protein